MNLFARTPRHTRWSRGIRSGVQCPESGDGRLRLEHECRGHWPYDRGCDDCVQSRGRTPARRVGHKHETPHSLAADFLFVAGKH